MQINMAVFSAFIPLILGIAYGVVYAINGYVFRQGVPLILCMMMTSVVGIIVWTYLNYSQGNFKAEVLSTISWKLVALVMVNSIILIITWALASYAMKHISPTFVAMGEVSYVLFTPLFAYLLFGRKELDFYTVTAGIIILIGCCVLVYGEYVKQAAEVTGVSS